MKYVIINGDVYDLTHFKHPYSSEIDITKYYGKDITYIMRNYHPKVDLDILKPYIVKRSSILDRIKNLLSYKTETN